MLVSKTSALPLGDTPTVQLLQTGFSSLTYQRYDEERNGWGTRIRTWECWYQKPVPYRLAIPQLCCRCLEMVREARLELAHLAALEPKSSASTNFATPAKKDGGYDGIRTCDPIIMSDVL